MKHCIERPREFCSLNGAIDVVGNIYRAIPIIHASAGCSLQAANMTNLYYLGGYHGLPSSNCYEKEVVFGGTQRLRETIQGSLDVMDGDIYAVLTGCSMSINGDDVESIVSEFKDAPYPVVTIDSGGFRGDTYYGYQLALLKLIQTLAKKTERDPLLVNLYGQVPSTDFTLRGDLEEIARILSKIGVKVNTFFIEQDGIQQLKNSGNAALNINLSPWIGKNIDAYYKTAFGIETLEYNGWPVGPTAVADFLRKVGDKLGIDKNQVEKAIADEEKYAYQYFDSLMGDFERHRFILVGETTVALGALRFLVNDYGHIPLAVIFTDTVPDNKKAVIEDEVRALEYNENVDIYFEDDNHNIEQIALKYKERLTVVLGSSYEKPLAKKVGTFFVNVSAPCLDKKTLNKSHIGIRGCITFIEDMYNHY